MLAGLITLLTTPLATATPGRAAAIALAASGLAAGDFVDVGPGGGDTPMWKLTLDSGLAISTARTFQPDLLLAAGDVDGDGRGDLLVGSMEAGTVIVRSGRDGEPIHVFTGDAAAGFGQAAGPAGDVDGDGRDDVIVGESLHVTEDGQIGRARVFSGRNGKVLLEIPGELAGDKTGYVVNGVGDVDGDGTPDLGVCSPGVSTVRVHSGADGAVLLDLFEPSPPNAIGQYVGPAGDVDGDGLADVLVSVLDVVAPVIGRTARVHAGVDGSVLFEAGLGDALPQLDVSMDAVGDLDGDGYDDIVGLVRDADGERASVFGGPDGRLLESFALGFQPGGSPPTMTDVAGAGDVDGDGTPDILVGTLELFRGGMQVFSGATGGGLRAFVFTDPNATVQVTGAGGGDVDGDGYADVLVANHQLEDLTGIIPSRGRVLFGGDPWFVRLGDRVRDDLFAGSFDTLRFEAVSGTRLDVLMRSVGKDPFPPVLAMTGPGGLITLGDDVQATARTARLRRFELPQTGSYELRLRHGGSGTAEPSGYRARTRSRPPRGKGTVDGAEGAAFVAGQRVVTELEDATPRNLLVDLPAGGRVTLRAGGQGGLRPALRLLDPDGADITPEDGVPHRIRKLVVPETGTYTVEVRALDGTTGGVTLKSRVKVPRGKARIVAAPSLELP